MHYTFHSALHLLLRIICYEVWINSEKQCYAFASCQIHIPCCYPHHIQNCVDCFGSVVMLWLPLALEQLVSEAAFWSGLVWGEPGTATLLRACVLAGASPEGTQRDRVVPLRPPCPVLPRDFQTPTTFYPCA